jgi:hypothetical protein
MPCFLLIKLFISFFIIIVYYEVVMVFVCGTPGPVHSSVAVILPGEPPATNPEDKVPIAPLKPAALVIAVLFVQFVPFHISTLPIGAGPEAQPAATAAV